MQKKICLTIAGSDSSGGAGIQADIKSIEANGVFAMSVITIITAQNSYEFLGIESVSINTIKNQINVLFKDYKIDAIKIGALYNLKIMEIVAQELSKYKVKNIVVDPVMVSKSGQTLMKKEDVKNFIHLFSPFTLLLTPNIKEASYILNTKIKTVNDMKKATKALQKMGFKNILLKGGHFLGNHVYDILLTKHFQIFKNKKIKTQNTHGTGCTLSSAIAANLAKNFSIEQSVQIAIKYTNNAIVQNIPIGKKHGPVNHFWKENHANIKE